MCYVHLITEIRNRYAFNVLNNYLQTYPLPIFAMMQAPRVFLYKNLFYCVFSVTMFHFNMCKIMCITCTVIEFI